MTSLSAFLVTLLVSASALAQQSGAVSTAAAGAGRAAVDPMETPSLNPASLPYNRGYFITSDYAVLENGSGFTLGLLDNLAGTVVPTALIYNQINAQNLQKQAWSSQTGLLEMGEFSRSNLAVGLGVRYRVDNYGLVQNTQTNLSLGTLFNLNPDVGFAAVVDNFLTPDGNVPTQYQLLPTTSFGFNYIYKKWARFKLDFLTGTSNDWGRPTLAGGVESHFNRWTVLRLGVSQSLDLNQQKYGMGFGFVGPRFAINYGYLSCPEDQNLNRHALDLAIPIW